MSPDFMQDTPVPTEPNFSSSTQHNWSINYITMGFTFGWSATNIRVHEHIPFSVLPK